MNTNKIRVFYDKKARGKLIAFVGENQIARWYKYSGKRFWNITRLLDSWNVVRTEQAITYRKEI